MRILVSLYILLFVGIKVVAFVDDLKTRNLWFVAAGVGSRLALFWLMLANWFQIGLQTPRTLGYLLFGYAILWQVVELVRDKMDVDSDPEGTSLLKWSSFATALLILIPAYYLAWTGIYRLS